VPLSILRGTLRLAIQLLALALSLFLPSLGVALAQGADVNQTLTSMYENVVSGAKATIERFLTGVQDLFLFTIRKGLEVLITLARASYVALGLLGLVLWATGISPYRGRHLVVGAVVLAIIAEVARGLLG